MSDSAVCPPRPRAGGRLVANIVYFARVLRAAGLPIGPGRVIDAVRAVQAVGITDRTDFYWTLHAVFVNRADQRELFDQAFHVFWRNPHLLERLASLVLPDLGEPDRETPSTLSRRLGEALLAEAGPSLERHEAPPEVEVDAELTWSDRELLRGRDFEEMSTEELERAKAAIARLRLPVVEVATRRFRPHPHGGRIDMRATLRASLRTGHGSIPLQHSRRRTRPPPLVLLCDISGSMSRYSRMLLHFAHALGASRDRVHAFVFGTRLSNITRHLRERDVDAALGRIAGAVEDWSGGTRIGHCLREFNRVWSRRVLGQGAVVLLITDGLDRDAGTGLAEEADRLHRSSRRLVWLNPLLRYDRFEPRAAGMRALLPHVDDFRAAHNIESLEALAQTLSRAEHDGVPAWPARARAA